VKNKNQNTVLYFYLLRLNFVPGVAHGRAGPVKPGHRSLCRTKICALPRAAASLPGGGDRTFVANLIQ
jgi:hypothetical protein